MAVDGIEAGPDREEGTVLFVVPDGANTASLVPVTVGIVSSDTTEIIEPRLSGRVITLGQHLLDEGSPILLPGGAERRSGASKSENDAR